ncbi:hypothetical protein BKA66DRAFT_249231 [Pyrenochaeta sp. MPI-SDFR-AT-0127]|nr:hypothetical protein BKA66DRAFT_249231 [Pyrenochaeta sp. MPI-SDFR-AT-0127]
MKTTFFLLATLATLTLSSPVFSTPISSSESAPTPSVKSQVCTKICADKPIKECGAKGHTAQLGVRQESHVQFSSANRVAVFVADEYTVMLGMLQVY